MIKLKWVPTDKKQYMELLLLGDEQESMIDRYLDRGTLYAALDGEDVVGAAVVTREAQGLYEVKNLAVRPDRQGQGVGGQIIALLCDKYRAQGGTVLRVGTGESPKTLSFYQHCGFAVCGREPDFFTRHYDHPIVEDGVMLRDMVYLEKRL